jgi:hypothetical protein
MQRELRTRNLDVHNLQIPDRSEDDGSEMTEGVLKRVAAMPPFLFVIAGLDPAIHHS